MSGGQGRAGRASLEFVNHCLRENHSLIIKENFRSLALPRGATGVGGLTWSQVFPLIKEHLSSLNLPIYVYSTYHKGEKAKENGQ